MTVSSVSQLTAQLESLLSRPGRTLLGIVGPPGAAKSSIAVGLVRLAEAHGCPAVQVPMDGFHLADVELDRLDRRDRKGAIDTFDGGGYRALLQRALDEVDEVVYAPAFDRELEQPIAGAIPILPEHRLVITEGNYLLDPQWPGVQPLLTAAWYCDLDDAERQRRLIERHIRFGKPPEVAQSWVMEVDEANARRVAQSRGLADLVISLDEIDTRTI